MVPKKKDGRKGKKPVSALNVVPGSEGGRDGVSGSEGARKAAAPLTELTAEQYLEGVLAGDRTVLGRALTLVESNAPAHQEQAQVLLKALGPHGGRSVRVGITGMPGAGKSTFIEALGTWLTGEGRRVAVTAVDPSSTVSRGSILGDKTRMERLSRDRSAFIRPSPTGGTLGGVARKTRETILVFEAAGYDAILVETVGVGQSEVAVRSMVDFFLLMLLPGAGDELQGIKRGVMELADALVVNKADGDRVQAARSARAEYGRALRYLQPATPGWETRSFTASALTGDGIPELWAVVEKFREITAKSGAFEARRREQSRAWLHQMIEERLKDLFYRHPAVEKILPGLERKVLDGSLPAARAAWELLDTFEKAAGG